MPLQPRRAPARIDPKTKSKLIVVVDTEEEFDWSHDHSRDSNCVRSIRWIRRLQDIFDRYGIKPVYVIDYPVVSQADGFKPLKEIYDDGHCLIGAHLHPWVNPPFEEQLNYRNSFPGNLQQRLEASKLEVLTDCIAERFGTRPCIYKAGRYGVGPNTFEILERQGFEVDVSVCPWMDYSAEGGPNFTGTSAWPFWFGEERRLLEIPMTVGFSGYLRKWGGPTLHRVASGSLLRSLHAVGLLCRLGLVDKSWLSPEGYSHTEQVNLVRALHQDGLRIFSFTLHSPSIEPGNTPYVRSKHDLDNFLSSCQKFFDFFLGDLNGDSTTPLQFKAELVSDLPSPTSLKA